MSSKSTASNYAGGTKGWVDRRLMLAIADELPALAEEIIASIQLDVPAYSRPLAGDFGRGIRAGTEDALRRFIGTGEAGAPGVYRRLGRGERGAGRSLDALQAAYRVGARVAWRRISELAAEGGADAGVQQRLAEAMFAYVEEISAESVEGYTEAQLEQAGDRERARAALFALLLSVPSPAPALLRSASQRARWELPAELVCVLVDGGAAAAAARRLSGDPLLGELDGRTGLLIAQTSTLAREAAAAASRLGVQVALGPTVAPSAAERSWRWAQMAGDQAAGPGLIVAEEQLVKIAISAAGEIVEALRDRSLAPLQRESATSRRRLEQTLHAWLRHRGSQQTIAAELSVHPQTVRYRLRRLRDLFGTALEDPDRRFELELALRAPGPTEAHARQAPSG